MLLVAESLLRNRKDSSPLNGPGLMPCLNLSEFVVLFGEGSGSNLARQGSTVDT